MRTLLRMVHQDTVGGDVLPAEVWRAEVLATLQAGGRPVSLFGRAGAGAGQVVVTALLERFGGELDCLRTSLVTKEGYPSISAMLPAFQGFERELHEQFGVALAGHPWLKPVRFEGGGGQAAMDAFPYHKVEGKQVHEVAVGPVHAGVIEPGSFRFMCHGERVLHLEIQLGYQHRGVERLVLAAADAGGPPGLRRALPLVETVAGDSSVAHATAFCLAAEALGGADVGDDEARATALSRGVLLELERIGMHLAGLAGMATDIAHIQGASTYGRLRTTAINAMMGLCGSRFGRSGVRMGAPGYTFDDSARQRLEAALDLLERDLPAIDDRYFRDPTVQQRLKSVGTVTPDRAAEVGMVGLCARASGLAIDQRVGGIYDVFPMGRGLLTSGDCWARELLRVMEIQTSLAWLRAVLRTKARWGRGVAGADRRSPLGAQQLAVGVVEGCRGEVIYALETDAGGRVVRVKVQDPSFRNWMGLAVAVRGGAISDFPLCNKSFDLSYCGHDL